MKPETQNVIKQCLKFKGGRSRPDKSIGFMLPYLKQCKEILDVGCGRGSLGWILKTESPGIVVHGIDIHRPYIGDTVQQYYDSITIGDYTERYQQMAAECIVFMDVLEHFPRDKAGEILEWLKGNACKIIISIPVAEMHWHQAEAYEKANPHEAHLHDWTEEELIGLGLTHVGTKEALGVFVYGF